MIDIFSQSSHAKQLTETVIMTTMYMALTLPWTWTQVPFGDTGLRQNEQLTQASLSLIIHIM